MAKSRILSLFFVRIFLTTFIIVALAQAAEAAAPVINVFTLRDPDTGSTVYVNNNYVLIMLSISNFDPVSTQVLLSEYNDFHDAEWIDYPNPVTYTFTSIYDGERTVYCKVRNSSLQESNIVHDTILMDVSPPRVTAAYCQVFDNEHVDIAFTEAMNNIAAPSYFTINNGVNVLSVQYQGGPYFSYRLTTSPQQDGSSHTVTVSSNAKDMAGNYIDPSARTYSYTMGSTEDTTPPVANAGPDKFANVGELITFDGSGSTDNVGVTRYVWNFEDGSSAEEGVIVTHPYASAGIYTATLTVYDAANNSDSDTAQAAITESPSGTYLEVGGPSPDYNTITNAMANIAEGGTIYVYAGVYPEIVHLKNNVTLKGDNNETVIIKGEIIAEEVGGTIENFSILYRKGTMLSFNNANYVDLNLMADAGITAVNSPLTIKNCIIKPDLDFINYEGGYDPPLQYYGKGIQIWNMYGTDDVAPQVESNLIQDTDCGIYYFSQAFGGAINGNIKNNTFYHNKDGIILRMHKENPHIYNNIFDNSMNSAIFFTYEDGVLFDQRKANINNNLFNQNTNHFWLDSEAVQFNLIGIQGNIEDDPEFVDPLSDNFYLEPTSPALTGGEGGTLMGAYTEFVSQLFIEILSPQDGITIYAKP
ncbi:MAG: PKD domain-containing protein [Candidatus Omnitrophica bacterium]|nr:PKD domain-containing protein [Candidatus Omnitrophota bacterium]MBU4487746.1 PKD domain-containing protein [Candidatus Omnitrophota bacterium]MCG2705286.1 PKD domain-containing protein [Candidatus Omnitrophota bacterium]